MVDICCRSNDENAKKCCSLWRCNKKEGGGPSNLTLLSTAFVSFLIFTAAQLCAALVANSQSMLADTGAMSVDICSYALNWFAERKKCNAKHKRQQLQLELIAPSFSVIALLGVTIYSLDGAIRTLLAGHIVVFNPSNQPNLLIMLLFSSLNLLLDILNVTCFARAKRLFGFKVSPAAVGIDNTALSQPKECVRSSSEDDFVVDDTVSICERGMMNSMVEMSTCNDSPSHLQICSKDQSSLLYRSNHVTALIAAADDEHSLVENDNNNVERLASNSPNNINEKPLITEDNHLKCSIIGDSSRENCSTAATPPESASNLNMCSAYTVRKKKFHRCLFLLLMYFLPYCICLLSNKKTFFSLPFSVLLSPYFGTVIIFTLPLFLQQNCLTPLCTAYWR